MKNLTHYIGQGRDRAMLTSEDRIETFLRKHAAGFDSAAPPSIDSALEVTGAGPDAGHWTLLLLRRGPVLASTAMTLALVLAGLFLSSSDEVVDTSVSVVGLFGGEEANRTIEPQWKNSEKAESFMPVAGRHEDDRNDGGSERRENTVHTSPAPFVTAVNKYELQRAELRHLGIHIDGASVYYTFRDSANGRLRGYRFSSDGTAMLDSIADIGFTAFAPVFHPAVITDGFGNIRVDFSASDDKHDSSAGSSAAIIFSRWHVFDRSIKTKLTLFFRAVGHTTVTLDDTVTVTVYHDSIKGERALLKIETESLPQNELYGPIRIVSEIGSELYSEILEKDYDHLDLRPEPDEALVRFATGHLVPILVPTKDRPAETKEARRSRREDFVFWYEATPEFLATLPDRTRRLVDFMLEHARLVRTQPNSDSAQRLMNQGPAKLIIESDSLLSVGKERPVATLPTESMGARFDTVSGAISVRDASYHPQIGNATIRYSLKAPRKVFFSLYSTKGTLIEILGEQTFRSVEYGAGQTYVLHLKKIVPPGEYILAVSTNIGERVLQRVVVE